jgi:hypothetical protein
MPVRSRIGMEPIKRNLLDQEQRSFAWLNAVRFRSGLQAAARDGATESFVQRLAGVQVLHWDDLGQAHLTGAASEMLLHIVEERTAVHARNCVKQGTERVLPIVLDIARGFDVLRQVGAVVSQ